MKKLLLALVVLGFTSCHKKTMEERIIDEIAHFNEHEAPKRMDEITILDSLSYDAADKTIRYCHRLCGMGDVDSLYTKEVRAEQRKNLLAGIKTNIQLKPYKEQGLNFEYCYYSEKSGKLIIKERFTKEDYQ